MAATGAMVNALVGTPAASARRAASPPPFASALRPAADTVASAGLPLATIVVVAVRPVTTGCVTLNGVFSSCERRATFTLGAAICSPRASCREAMNAKAKLPASSRRWLVEGNASLPWVLSRARRMARTLHPALGGSPQIARPMASWAFAEVTNQALVEKETAEA